MSTRSIGARTPSGLAPHQEGLSDPARVTFLDVPTSADIERIAALRPDLILAVNDFTLEQDYPELSRIAPTVGYATAWGEQSWQEQAVVDATALGMADRGRRIVAETQARIRAVRDADPGLVGRSVTFSFTLWWSTRPPRPRCARPRCSASRGRWSRSARRSAGPPGDRHPLTEATRATR